MAKQQFLDLAGLNVLVDQINEKIKSVVESFPSKLDFPTIGKNNTIYIDTESNVSYRWDDDNLKYYIIGFNPNNISEINGGGSR